MPVIPKQGATCSSCKEFRSQKDFYLRNPETGNRFARCAYCFSNSYKAKNPSKKEVLPDGMKRCSDCLEVLNVYDFPRWRNGYPKQPCEACAKKKRASYKAKHKEQIKARSAVYRQANREEIAAKQRRWREEHPEQYFEIHATWKRRNAEACKASRHRRRLKRDAAPGTYTAQEWQALKKLYDFRCLMCYQREPDITLTVDHIVPIDKGGSNMIDNLQPLCKSCNSRKHTNIIDLRPFLEVVNGN